MVGIGSALRPLVVAFAAKGSSQDGGNAPGESPPSSVGGAIIAEADAIGRLRALGMDRKESSPRHMGLRRASVLVPLFERESSSAEDDDGVHVLLTRRPLSMSSHGGEVCLPGGKMDDDVDLGDDVRTALREAHEEVGIHPSHVEVVARLGTLESKHSLCVTPIIGLVRPSEAAEPDRLTLNPEEVECAFAVPLRYFANPDNVVSEETVTWRGGEFTIRAYDYEDVEGGGRKFVIWGLTAHIVRLVAMMAYGVDGD